MRLWSLHPRHLDRQGLTGCWRETLLAQAVLALADADASGALDQAEFTRLLGGCGVARDEAERVFRRFDGDGCGAVNASEIVAAVRDFLTGRSLEAPGSWLFGRG